MTLSIYPAVTTIFASVNQKWSKVAAALLGALGFSLIAYISITNPKRIRTHSSVQSLRYRYPSIFVEEYEMYEAIAYQKLIDGIISSGEDGKTRQSDVNHFQDLLVSFPVPRKIVHHMGFTGEEHKYFFGLRSIAKKGKEFIVYSAGNNMQTDFEENAAALGASVFSFDCTIAGDNWTSFSFFPWCLGKKESNSADSTSRIFYSLSEIMGRLNHRQLDLLKLDIEGYEWEILYDDVIRGKFLQNNLPQQLIFELHTEGSNTDYVNPYLVQGKRRAEVARLVLDLHHLGYRLMHFQINHYDEFCAELAFVNIHV